MDTIGVVHLCIHGDVSPEGAAMRAVQDSESRRCEPLEPCALG